MATGRCWSPWIRRRTRLGQLREWLRSKTVAIPGLKTSAYLALRLFAPEVRTITIQFDEIFEAVKAGKADVGLIIHEGQITYADQGFKLALDLGSWWKSITGLPLPLGGNVIRKDIPRDIQKEVCRDSQREHRLRT